MKSNQLTMLGTALLFFLGTTNLTKINTLSTAPSVTVRGAVGMNQDGPLISIQGTFKDADGIAVADGEQTIVFKLYHQESGGTALWEETADVFVKGGLYSHNLGSVEPINPDIFSSTVYLGVETNGFELSPRGMMTYSPYSLFVQYAATAGKSDNGVPTGSVMPYAGSENSVPNGYLLCNGQEYDKDDYPDLFAVIGTTYGGNSAVFNVPDYRNMFLRGNTSGRALGSLQEDATAPPNNTFTTNSAGGHNHSIRTSISELSSVNQQGCFFGQFNVETNVSLGLEHNLPCSWSGADFIQYRNNGIINSAGAHTHNISGGDSETRPRNRSVNYIIKY
jgi:microcystin-dependent protein